MIAAPYTTDAAGGFPLDIHRPDGSMALQVQTSSNPDADVELAKHVVSALNFTHRAEATLLDAPGNLLDMMAVMGRLFDDVGAMEKVIADIGIASQSDEAWAAIRQRFVVIDRTTDAKPGDFADNVLNKPLGGL